MNLFKMFRTEAGGQSPKTESASEETGQLVGIAERLKADNTIRQSLALQLSERHKDMFATPQLAEAYINSIGSDSEALGLAKLVDQTLGEGTFRTLSFLGKDSRANRNVAKLLKNNIDGTSFEKQVEKGHYLNLLETYGVNWDLEKVSRDALQNFFDANGQTLDGVSINTSIEEVATKEGEKKVGKVRFEAPQDYDWRELIHFGGTTKTDSDTSVGGFGEGLKIAAFVLLKEHGAKRVKAASRDWEIDYYFDDVNSEAYRKSIQGLYAKKGRRKDEIGNYLEIVFEGDEAEEKLKLFEKAKELFYSSENPDFYNPSFNDKSSGGFQILPLNEKASFWDNHSKGNVYLAGQRIHYDTRDKWENISDLNVWTWRKIQPKDRDRGMITRQEMTKDVLPLIISSMTEADLKKSVYDFKPLWPHIDIYSVSDELLEQMVNKLAQSKTTLEFENEYVASDVPQGADWIRDALKSQGFKFCRGYMKKIGMKGAMDQFRVWQAHSRVETRPGEEQKIAILKKASRLLELPEDELKDVWIFSAKEEQSALAGQYNSLYYWMSRESFDQPLSDALHTYVHEAAHKEGPHGNAKFDYALQDRIQRIHRFILDNRAEWEKLEEEWKSIKKD